MDINLKNVKKDQGDGVGLEDISAASKTLEVQANKFGEASRINHTDAYKAFIKKAADDPSYTADIRDGIGDYDRFLMGRKRELQKMKKKDHFHELDKDYDKGIKDAEGNYVKKSLCSNGFVDVFYDNWVISQKR
jgi:hypothetical protein